MKNLFYFLFVLTSSIYSVSAQEQQSEKLSSEETVSIIRLNQDSPITLQEWNNYMKKDTSIQLKKTSNKTSTNKEENQFIIIEQNISLDFKDGRISVKNPTKSTLLKLYQISKRLGAELINEKGNVYNDAYFFN